MDPVTRTTLAQSKDAASLALDLVDQDGCKELGAISDRYRSTMVS